MKPDPEIEHLIVALERIGEDPSSWSPNAIQHYASRAAQEIRSHHPRPSELPLTPCDGQFSVYDFVGV